MNFILIPNLSDLYAENCGLAILSPGWKHIKRKIDTSVLILGYKGEVELQSDSTFITISPGTICILPEGTIHKGVKQIESSAQYYWIHFKSTSPPEVLSKKEALSILNNREIAKTRLNNALLLPQNLTLKKSTRIREAFYELLYEQQKECFTDQKYQIYAKLMLINLNEIIFSHFDDHPINTAKISLENRIIQLIYENMTDSNFSVKVLADKMCYNPDYLNRHFKAIMKRSLIEYIIDKRIEHSLIELIDSNNTLSTVAANSGFPTYRNYIRQFKLRKNMIPSEFRNRYRLMHINNV